MKPPTESNPAVQPPATVEPPPDAAAAQDSAPPPPILSTPPPVDFNRRLETWVFWLIYAGLLVYAGTARSYHIDMPPYDYPAARQLWNIWITGHLMQGASIFNISGGWVEIQYLAWLTARTSWLASLFDVEVWTIGRAWSAFFSTLSVALAPFVMYLAISPKVRRSRRLRIALLFMAAMAFNPFLERYARILMNGPMARFIQLAALFLFLYYYRYYDRRPRAYAAFVLFLLLIFISGTARLTTLAWMPAIVLYMLFDHKRRWKERLILPLLTFAGVFLVFAVYRINPFDLAGRFMADFPHHWQMARDWMGNLVWFKTYIGRVLLMLTVPGLFFALIGLLSAPNIFRITFLLLLVFYYPLVNQNVYNYSHLVMPGMALAAWGIDFLLETATSWHLRQYRLTGRWSLLFARRANEAVAVAAIAAIVLLMMPLSPKLPHEDTFFPQIGLARQVAREHVPPGTKIVTDGIDGFSNLFGLGFNDLSRDVNLSSGYYVAFDRFSEATLRDASRAWIQWASLPGEFSTLLLTNSATRPAVPRQGYGRMDIPLAESETFGAARLDLPADRTNPRDRILHAVQGETLQIGITWKNQTPGKLVLMSWEHRQLGRYVPPPVRQGGMTYLTAAILHVPTGHNPTALYSFEIPRHFPVGDYVVTYFPIEDLNDLKAPQKKMALPITLRIEPAKEDPPPAAERLFVDLYPLLLDRQPDLWSEAWFFKNMRAEGYTVNRNMEYAMATPARPAGKYRFSLRGSSIPITQPHSPEMLWSKVHIALSHAPEHRIGTIVLDAAEPEEHALEFTAKEPFDSILLEVEIQHALNGTIPVYFTEFIPGSYGMNIPQQLAKLRGATLTPLAP